MALRTARAAAHGDGRTGGFQPHGPRLFGGAYGRVPRPTSRGPGVHTNDCAHLFQTSAISRARGRVSAKFSHTILSITVNGTASTIPTAPQHRPQNARAISTTSGLRSTAWAVSR